MSVCVCVCVCGRRRRRKVEKQNPKFDEFILNVDVERFGYNNLLQDFEFMKSVKIAMDV